MGEVYRARDSRLGRDVAIKVLPAEFSADPDRLKRFEKEARAAAALNHPNILAIYDVGSDGPATYVVSELLDGQSFRDALAHGALPNRRVVDYAVQTANGLAAAHQKGIVHRDLKPENLFVTSEGRVKILDFGLAKLVEAVPSGAGESMMQTVQVDTTPGMVLGTVGYMSPEQVRGLPADNRSDIFALGTVLYEMLSGHRAFRGDTTADTMTAILKEDPPDLPIAERQIPPALARIVDRCLQKNPASRFQSAGDLAFAIESLSAHSGSTAAIAAASSASRVGHPRIAWALAGIFGVGFVGLAGVGYYYVNRPIEERAITATILTPSGVRLDMFPPPSRIAISPDGRRLTFVAGSDRAHSQLFVRPVDALSEQALAGTEGAFSPFWSPDSRFIGFFTLDGKVKKIDPTGGPAVTICDAVSAAGVTGGTWNQDGVILVGSAQGIQRVSASGGVPQPVVKGPGPSPTQLLPWFLPDGRSFLFRVGSANNPAGSEIRLALLDSNDSTVIVKDASQAMYAQGHLLFTRGGTLMAQTFDLGRKQLVGDPVPIAEGLQTGGGGNSTFSVSTNGVLVYQPGFFTFRTKLTWFDRAGKASGNVGSDANYGDIALSPDGRQASVTTYNLTMRNSGGDIWLFDLGRNVPVRFSFEDKGVATTSIWSPDNKTIVFNSSRKGRLDLYLKASTGTGGDDELLVDDADKYPLSWSSDGKFILYRRNSANSIHLWVLPTTADRKPFPFMNTRFNEDMGGFSPDGRWIVFRSNESGRAEIYAAPFPGPGKKVPISLGGADLAGDPQWRGREIFYIASDGKLMAVPVNGSGTELEVGTPKTLFEIPPFGRPLRHYYDVTADGERFLVNISSQSVESSPLTLVVNWTVGLRH